MSTPGLVPIGIVTVSDRASRGEYEDRGGPAIQAELERAIATPWQPVTRVVPDDRERIVRTLTGLARSERCALVLTTGGTGPSLRDITPEATLEACDKLLPGFGERMRSISWERVPTSILSRQLAGIIGKTLIVNLPGSPGAIAECLQAVLPAIPHCLELIGAPALELRPGVVPPFHPGH